VAVTLDDARAEFPVLAHTAYLNTGTFGPLPRRTVETVIERERDELEHGRSGPRYFPGLRELRERVRAALARVVGAGPGEIAITRSTTDGCNVVLAGLDLAPEDEIVTTDLEHFGLLGALGARGVRVRVAPLAGRSVAEVPDLISRELSPRTRLIAVSHVSWATGQVLPLAALAELGPPVLADGAQGAGAVPVDVSGLGCAFYTVSGQKWLLGPDATGGLYVRGDWVERLRVAFPSYYGQAGHEPDGTTTFVEGAPRFDVGTVAGPTLAGLEVSLSLAEELGPERFVRARELTERCRSLLAERAHVVTEPGQATLVSWRPAEPAAEVVARLAAAGVVVRDLPRWGWVRASVGWWSSEDDLQRLVAAL
jgi:L-cysteine/cystine lyase